MIETDKNVDMNKDVYGLLHLVKSSDGKNNLYDHLRRLYETKEDLNNDHKFMDLLEDISIRIKKNGNYFEDDNSRQSLLNYLQEFEKNSKTKKKLLDPLVKIDPDGGEPQVITSVTFVPEYHSIFQTLEWVGISIGEKESYMLTNSLRNLAFNKNLPNGVSFWGKIYGTEKDYYIAEAVGVEPGESSGNNDNIENDVEKRNDDGVNKNTFFVTNDLTGDWVDLPDVKPSQIRAARKIRYIFTGNLKKTIVTNPHFPGSEKEYLRCQIARISHGTKIEPNINHWKADTDTPFKPLEKNEEAKPMKLNEYLSLKYWIHFLPGILNQGRVSHFIEIPEDSPDPDEYRKKKMEEDPFDKRIKSIFDDNSLPSSIPKVKIPAWKIQYVYDDKIYINPNIKLNPDDEEPKDNTTNYVVICIKSLRWPGAYTVRSKNENYFFYFGWGQKFADYGMREKFVYEDFPTIPKDIADYEDFPEPNSPPHEKDNVDDVNRKLSNDDD